MIDRECSLMHGLTLGRTMEQRGARNHNVIVHIVEVKFDRTRCIPLILVLCLYKAYIGFVPVRLVILQNLFLRGTLKQIAHLRTRPGIVDDTTNLVAIFTRVPGIIEHLYVTGVTLNYRNLVGETLTGLFSVKVHLLNRVKILIRADRRNGVGHGG